MMIIGVDADEINMHVRMMPLTTVVTSAYKEVSALLPNSFSSVSFFSFCYIKSTK